MENRGNPNPQREGLKLRYFGFRGNAQFVYLAKPVGPGPLEFSRANGQTVCSLLAAETSQTVGPLARKTSYFAIQNLRFRA
ncbi:MAG: hypothetical protein ACK5T6_10945, partial [Pirellula sp.]